MENTTLNIDTNAIYNMDCLEGMCGIKDKSIDMILVDPPYGTTACKWDSTLPLNDYIEIKKKKSISFIIRLLLRLKRREN